MCRMAGKYSYIWQCIQLAESCMYITRCSEKPPHLTVSLHKAGYICVPACFFLIYMQKMVDMLRGMFDKYVAKVLEFRRKNCRELVPTSHLNAVSSLCYLLDALVTPENGVRMRCQARGGCGYMTYR